MSTSTYPTRTLPTDRNGITYYGPRTYEQGVEAINQDREFHAHSRNGAASIIGMMERAGFTRAAKRLRVRFVG